MMMIMMMMMMTVVVVKAIMATIKLTTMWMIITT